MNSFRHFNDKRAKFDQIPLKLFMWCKHWDLIAYDTDRQCIHTWLGDRMKNGRGIGESPEDGHSSSAMSDRLSLKPPPWSITLSNIKLHCHHWSYREDHLTKYSTLNCDIWVHINCTFVICFLKWYLFLHLSARSNTTVF